MKNIFLMVLISISLIACERQDKPTSLSTNEQDYDNDNTGKNTRDRDSSTKTPLDQSENEADRTITQKIRQAIISDSALSTNAKNIKIITINGVVTLRGPVASSKEREVIVRKVNDVQGVIKVDNQLEITRSN